MERATLGAAMNTTSKWNHVRNRSNHLTVGHTRNYTLHAHKFTNSQIHKFVRCEAVTCFDTPGVDAIWQAPQARRTHILRSHQVKRCTLMRVRVAMFCPMKIVARVARSRCELFSTALLSNLSPLRRISAQIRCILLLQSALDQWPRAIVRLS